MSNTVWVLRRAVAVTWSLVFFLPALLAGCSSGASEHHDLSIGRIVDLKSQFGPEFAVKVMEPAGLDARLLSPAPLPPGIKVDPPDCAKYSSGSSVPTGLEGNMAAVTATGQGNQFVAIALETSKEVPFDPAILGQCRKVTFRGDGIAGQTETLDAPTIDNARTVGVKRDVLSGASGKAIGQEQISYSACLGRYLVVVTASPVAVGNVPPALPNVQRASDLLVKAVAAVRN